MKQETILSIIMLSVILISAGMYGLEKSNNDFDYCDYGRVYKYTFDIIPEYKTLEHALFYENIYYDMDQECFING